MKSNKSVIQMVLLASSASACAFVPYGCQFGSNDTNRMRRNGGCSTKNNNKIRKEQQQSSPSVSALWMVEPDLDRMYTSELQKLVRQMGYDPTGRDRVDLITICKGYGSQIGAKPINEGQDQYSKHIASSTANNYYNGIHLARKSLNQNKPTVEAAAPGRQNPRVNQGSHPSKVVDDDMFDRMYTSDLEKMAQQMGFDIARRDRVDLIMICKGYGDVIGATRITSNPTAAENEKTASASSPANNNYNGIHLTRLTKNTSTNPPPKPPQPMSAVPSDQSRVLDAAKLDLPFGTFGIASRNANASSPANNYPNGLHLINRKPKQQPKKEDTTNTAATNNYVTPPSVPTPTTNNPVTPNTSSSSASTSPPLPTNPHVFAPQHPLKPTTNNTVTPNTSSSATTSPPLPANPHVFAPQGTLKPTTNNPVTPNTSSSATTSPPLPANPHVFAPQGTLSPPPTQPHIFTPPQPLSPPKPVDVTPSEKSFP